MSDGNLFAADAAAYQAGTYTSPQYVFPVDAAEAARVGPYVPATPATAGIPWWERLIVYGATRAIDNAIPGPTGAPGGNTQPGTFAGQNGATYANGTGARPGTTTPAAGQMSGTSVLMLAGLAYLALR